MTKRLILFALWCAALSLGSVVAAYHAYSFDSDEENRPAGAGQAGPSHK